MKLSVDNHSEFICPWQLPDGPCLGKKCVAFKVGSIWEQRWTEPGTWISLDEKIQFNTTKHKDTPPDGGDWRYDCEETREEKTGPPWWQPWKKAQTKTITYHVWQRDVVLSATCQRLDRLNQNNSF